MPTTTVTVRTDSNAVTVTVKAMKEMKSPEAAISRKLSYLPLGQVD